MHPTCSIKVMDVTGSVTDTILHICTLYKKKYAVRIRDAKKVRYLLALQSARAAACLAHPLPPFSPRVGRRNGDSVL